MRLLTALALLVCVTPALAAPVLDLSARRIDGAGWNATGVKARLALAGKDSLRLQAAEAELNYSEPSGRFAAEKLVVRGGGTLEQVAGALRARLDLKLVAGQAYVEPVFGDFAAQPATLDATLRFDRRSRALHVEQLLLAQAGVGKLEAQGRLSRPYAQHHRLSLKLREARLGPLVELYVKPFLAATRLDDLAGNGRLSADLELADRQPQSAQLQLQDGQLGAAKLDLQLDGLQAALHWDAKSAAEPSRLAWQGARVGKLPFGPARFDLQAQPRGLRLLQAVRVPLLDGAVQLERLALGGIGTPAPTAEFAATIEPIELSELCRALGWPEFSGRLAGNLPGLRYADRTLTLDGELHAQAFDGEIRMRSLRVIEPFSTLPRLATDIQLRNLDLETLTGAFSFGRIEGRIDGDVEGLRLVGWQPVAMKARLYTPPGDDSRHRISQRAIDMISSIGGGPGGLLQRGVLRFFDDFAYDRIGWSCVLANGVCTMDGIEPARDGKAYVLVKGKLLPRIDVIGFTRSVNWETLVERLKAARANPAPTVERQ